jgi:hypothetical protein
MKIGFSLGRCVRDIVDGVVAINDVLVIVTRTFINEREQLRKVIDDYMWERDYLEGRDRDLCYEVAETLWDLGKFHQPRCYGARTTYVPENFVWMDVVPTAQDQDPSVREAWDAYRMLLVMRGNNIPAR